jgi:hypothetical protein
MLFDYYIFSSVKQVNGHYLITIIDNRSLLGSSEYLIKAENKTQAEKTALSKHENLTKK